MGDVESWARPLTVDAAMLLGWTEPIQVAPLAAVAVVAAAIVLSVPRVTWRWFGLITTLVHELGHAFAAAITGRRISGIRINMNHSGSMASAGGNLSFAVSGAAGYPAPALTGLAMVWAVFAGYPSAALVVIAVWCGVTMLVFIRNAAGFLVLAAVAAAAGLLWWFGSSQAQSWTLLVVAVALIVGAVRGLLTVIAVHVRRRAELHTSDAYLLWKATGIPSPVWLLLWTGLVGGSAVCAFSVYNTSI